MADDDPTGASAPEPRRARSVHSRKFSADVGAIPVSKRKRSLSFSWILYGHKKVASQPRDIVPLRRFYSMNYRYPHGPLESASQQIRLVHLQPAPLFSEPIVCQLETVFVRDHPMYEALSYCWGDEHDTKRIFVNDVEYHVTSSLDSALRHLRHAKDPRTLWIDAISINQVDVEEKSIQVQQMGNIFSNSKRVVIWLGQRREETDIWKLEVDNDLLDKALNLARQLRIVYELLWSEEPFHWAQGLQEHIKRIGLSPASTTDHDGHVMAVLINLLGRPWFSRAWVIQEANIHDTAPDVVIGFARANLVDLTYTAHYLAIVEDFGSMQFGQPSPDYLFPPFQMQDIRFSLAHPAYQALVPALQLLILLSMTSASFRSSDSRDRVFALLGLIRRDGDHKIVRADYSKSFDGVILETAIALLEHSRSYSFLALADTFDSTTPSWAPRWNRPVIYARHETHFEDFFPNVTNFPGQHLFRYDLNDDSSVLHASGVFIGEIVEHRPIPPLETSQDLEYRYTQNAETLQDFEAILKELSSFQAGFNAAHSSETSVFAHVFEGGRYQWTWRDDIHKYDALMDREPNKSPHVTDEAKSYYLTALQLIVKDDIIFATSKGHIGRTLLGPNGLGVAVGDRLALFPGCPWPIHLRPTADKFRVLGQCYLHGYMQRHEHQAVYDQTFDNGDVLEMIPLI